MMNRTMMNTAVPCSRSPLPQKPSCPGKAKVEQKKLLQYINEVSFALNDLTLFLDTHCHDENALNYFYQLLEKRSEALKDYARWYGPLTLDSSGPSNQWEWSSQPWPWEGGAC